jgi:hypothetical protein
MVMGGTATTPLKRLGAWLARVDNTVYQAATDGFVCAFSAQELYRDVQGLSDAATPPTILRQRHTQDAEYLIAEITFPIRKTHYWKTTGAAIVWWIPFEP